MLAALVLAACQSDYELAGEPPDVDPGDVTECGFTPISGTVLSQYDCNPVFSPEEAGGDIDSVGFHTTNVLSHPFYQVWYSTVSGGSGYNLRYAASGDGTNWEDHPDNPLFTSDNGAWDQDSMDAIQVVWDEEMSRYVMSYQGITFPTGAFDPGKWGLGVATSPDGVTWTKHPANPVIDFVAMAGSGFEPYLGPCWPLDLTTNGSGFTGYMAAGWVDPWLGGDPECDVYSTQGSATLDVWNFAQNPILSSGGPYDTAGIAGAAIAQLDGVYYMFYIGFEEWVQGNGYVSSLHHHLNLATSTDGFTWTKSPDNPLPVSLTQEGLISAVGAEVIGNRIHLWITDHYDSEGGQAIGYYLFEPTIDPHP